MRPQELKTASKLSGTVALHAKNPPESREQRREAWLQIKVRAKQIWETLTDNDFNKAAGSAEKLYSIIQEKCGETREIVVAKLKTPSPVQT